MNKTDKHKEIFDLDKIPNHIFIKQLEIELGKERAYIEELQEEIEALKELASTKQIRTWKEQIKGLEARNKSLRELNNNLIYKNAQLLEKSK